MHICVSFIIALLVILLIIHILTSHCGCGNKTKSKMFDPVIAGLPIPGSFNPNTSNNQLQIGVDPSYSSYLGTRYGSA